MSDPTPEQKAATAGIFKNIVHVLEHGMFFGANAGYVAEAIGFLKANVAAIEAPPAPLHAVPEAKEGDLDFGRP